MSSAGQIIGGIVGAVIGLFAGGNVVIGAQIGMAIGGALDQPDRYGPKLSDLRTQVSSYGANIPFEYGTNRHAGTLIWPRILEATEHDNVESSKGGADVHTYTYTMSFAVLVCEGPIAGIRRIWANKRLVYDISAENTGAIQDPALSSLRIYLGTDDQDVDPLIEATETNTPAYRGYAYVVFENYDVTELSARVPQFEFEVITSGDLGDLDAVAMGECGFHMAVDTITGHIWSVDCIPNEQVNIYVTDHITGELINKTIWYSDAASSMGNDITFVPTLGSEIDGQKRGQFWITNENGPQILIVDPDTYEVISVEDDFYWPPGSGGTYIRWRGLIKYCAPHDKIAWGITNVDDDVYVINPVLDPGESTSQPEAKMTLSGSIYGVDQLLTIPDGREAALGRHNVYILNINGINVSPDVVYYNVDIGTAAYMACDEDRNRILVINNASENIFELNLDTGVYTDHDIVFPDDLPLNASKSFYRIIWHSHNDKYYVTAHHAGLRWTLYTINPNTFEIENVTLYIGPTNIGTLLEVPGHPEYLAYLDSGSNQIWKLPLYTPISPNQVLLSDIVEDVCVRSGLDAADINVTQLTDLVDGYLIGRQAQARACIEPLQQAYFFDVVESDDKIKFVKRGQTVTVTNIPMNERAAREFGQDAPENLSIVRTADLELPYQCDVEYSDVDSDHLIGNQYERRIVKDTKQRMNLQLAIAMTAQKAKQIAKVNLYESWRRQTYKFTTTRKYAYLEPTDLVSLPTDSVTYVAKIVSKREQPNGVIEWEAVFEDIEIYSQDGADAVSTLYSPQTIFSPDRTILKLLDIPILRDEDDNAGYYVAMGGAI